MVIVWFWRMLYVMACHVAMHTTLHGDTRVSDNVIPRHHHETKKEAACLPDQVVEELFFELGIYPISIAFARKYIRVLKMFQNSRGAYRRTTQNRTGSFELHRQNYNPANDS